ncbi:MAG: hypothetical protein UU05_C0002G0039 [Candidatus Curtissbacteria bacterium GW2011_GWA1_40_47]|uniref:Asl1-like glycosyl hydrolase catalytic domain-containing protein n=1 Tax=Candidatus Curtissbacteria bacterium RIFOXYA1_FULL_41_14 TaxID=1797737 RepID=A0A1F5HB00_9BACT|nr:MAG: hypothetical protein UT95_C0001G0040 [Candidatus Curtissbacteria bacterium GW2011_GWB1_40_28]KKR62326.1 MAG: hypothetical protein UU00_C0001G0046 [Microgenomates group bacterium GW2011_GWC1_40_35]KKR66328.1 MAG: hypothetical protein UU05_C0002G0039 [Candidatus Curtissbacteria bacterium GW2011_GWA1_40_47]KKR77867.1 MAG: hypothetical protein UU19_C0001G0013 [Candidatus Curtissbacteria bacterium GW2011_GWD1_40_8]KKS02494.1 MAG: hypothetical protein UU53_C0001G0039 [Candidatus Curtissbacter
MKYFCLWLIIFLIGGQSVLAVNDPGANPNNKVGVGTLSPNSEVEEIDSMVNANGDWGWVVILVKKSEMNLDRWQGVFHLLTKHHLIPIVRIATEFDQQGFWQRPADEDAKAWANFLSSLYWPTKNRYVLVYNEVNRAEEWGGKADAADYAKELEKTINVLKEKSADFFILPSPLDLSLNTHNGSLDASIFYKTMESTTPQIFTRIDGWSSHSYPNPNFTSSPFRSGRLSIKGYEWELSQIESYIKGRNLPVFITETGWKRKIQNGEGVNEDLIRQYYKIAFEKVWNDKRVVAVTPFIFNYPESLYYPFSFKTNEEDSAKEYFDYFFAIRDLPKVKGEPQREDLAADIQTDLPGIIIKDSTNNTVVTFKNTGNYIWKTDDSLRVNIDAQPDIQIEEIKWEKGEIYPGETAVGKLKFESNSKGPLSLAISIKNNDQLLAQETVTTTSETYFSLIARGIKNLF